jgi:E3 ubiquitin-protein ligase DOA10
MAEFEELSTRTALLSEHYPVCRICLQDDNLQELIRPCICKGTHRFVHRECASEWLKVSKKTVKTLFRDHLL